MGNLAKALITLGVLAATAVTTSAFTCSRIVNKYQAKEESLKALGRYQAIFFGEVVDAQPLDKYRQALRVRVVKEWKGITDNEVNLTYTAGDEEYGFPAIGSKEIFYAVLDDGVLVVPHCGKSDGEVDTRMIETLGPGKDVGPLVAPPPTPEAVPFFTWLWEKIASIF